MWASCPGDVGQDTQKLTLNVTYHVLERISPFYVFQGVWTKSLFFSLGRCLINMSLNFILISESL